MNNTMTTRLAALRRWLRPLWPWLRWGTAALLALLLVLDFAFPPPLPKQRDTSTLVVAADGTPLRAFALTTARRVLRRIAGSFFRDCFFWKAPHLF